MSIRIAHQPATVTSSPRTRARAATRAPRRQRGAVLIAFMLMFVVGASFVLLSELNEFATRAARDQRTARALAEAKRAVIGFAASFPDRPGVTNPEGGPGLLPCPATDTSGQPAISCSDAGGTTLGRLPWNRLDLSDPVDGAGERLWYAISENYRYTNITVPLNSETPGNLSVDGAGDVVAVILAPGFAVPGQDRAGSDDPADYLEDANTDTDGTFVSRAPGPFNDRVLAITRRELARAAERRALGEAARTLRGYYGDYGAYPWLAAFVDPRAQVPSAGGTVTTAGGTTLTDSAADFNAALGGVSGPPYPYRVRNLTDGSQGRVSGWSATTVTVNGLTGGAENDFDIDDEYVIDFHLNGTATAGGSSPALWMEDSSRDFQALGVAAGDLVVDQWDAGCIGAVAPGGVAPGGDTDRLELTSLAGDGCAVFDVGHDYEILRTRGHGTPGIREGHLPYHLPGERFVSDFGADWDLSSGSITTAVSPASPPLRGAYATALADFAETSAFFPGGLDVSLATGRCNWSTASDVDCTGTVSIAPWFTGAAGPGSGGTTLMDPGRNFGDWGVTRGDLVYNTSDGDYGIVGSAGAGQLDVDVPSLGSASIDFNDGDDYRARIATRAATGQMTLQLLGLVFDAAPSYSTSEVTPGDVVVNDTTGQVGILRSVTSVFGLYMIVVERIDGTLWSGFLGLNDAYRIRHDWVEEREYRLAMRFSGTVGYTDDAGVRERSVTSTGTLPARPATPTITVEDRDGAGATLATARVTLDTTTAVAADATITASGIRTDFTAGTAGAELPEWFTANRWARMIVAGYIDQDGPGGVGVCTAGTDCIVLGGSGDPNDNKRALVVVAGAELPGTTPPQDRTVPATLQDYFEDDNAVPGNELFDYDRQGNDFNDHFRILDTAP